MPSGEYDTPGPFQKDGPYIKRGLNERDEAVFMHHTDQAEREEFIGLLNKGTHFEGMLEALKRKSRGHTSNCGSYHGHDCDCGLDDSVHEAIAAAEAK